MQWIKDNDYNSSNQKLIIEYLPHFEKVALSQFKVFIEVETTTHCYVCDNCQKSIFIRSAKVKEDLLFILQMLRIHTGLRKWNKNNVYDKHPREIDPIGIDKPCIKIADSELLFDIYRMARKRDKDAIEIQKDDVIKHNQIFFDFMLRMFNHLNELYVKEKVF